MTPAPVVARLAGWILLAGSAPAADPDLDRLERDYLTQRDVIVRPLLTGFAEKLRSLHASLSQRQDPRAAEVKDEFDRTVLRLSQPAGTEPPATPVARPPGGTPAAEPVAPGPIELRGPKAVLAGDAVFDQKGVAAVQFKGKGATASWKLPAVKPGRCRIRLECGCAAGFGALAQIVVGDHPPRTLTILPTGEKGPAVSFNFGELDLAPGTTTLTVRMIDIPPRTKGSGGFNLHLIGITPVEGPRAE